MDFRKYIELCNPQTGHRKQELSPPRFPHAASLYSRPLSSPRPREPLSCASSLIILLSLEYHVSGIIQYVAN